MFLFIAIIFIAELIIASSLISNIMKADRYVCNLNEKVTQYRPKIEKVLFSFTDCLKCINSSFESATTFLKRKQQEFKMRIIKTIIIYGLLLVMRSKFKKLATVCKYIVLTKDYWDGLSV